jgi:hypothetical protein
MIPGFEKIVEDRIRMARKKGAFDDLSGSGEPLNLEDDRHIPEDLRLSHKILKNADCLPPELEIKKEIRRTEDLLAGMTDTRERYRVMKKLNYLIMKLNATRNSAIQFEVPQRYQESLIGRVNSAKKENRE